MKLKHWMRKEEETLTKHYNNGLPVEEIATILGRTEVAVRARVEYMRLTRAVRPCSRKKGMKLKHWTREEEETLTKHYNNGLPVEEIAAILGRTEIAVKARAMGLKKLPSNECRSCIKYEPDDNECIVFTEFLAWGSPCPGREEIKKKNIVALQP